MKKAVFIDKDGTLIPDIPYNVKPELITLSANAAEGLKELQEQGFLLVIISNQPGVAYGLFTEKELVIVKVRIEQLLEKHNVTLDGFYYCPHYPEGKITAFAMQCECRKPMPGLILKAATDIDIDLSQSWMIGDILNDVQAGNTAGCKTILIDNGNETEWELTPHRVPLYTVTNINEAAAAIISHERNIVNEEVV